MKSGRMLFAVVLVGMLGLGALAQGSAAVVKISPALSVDKVRQGSPFQVAVVVDIDRGYHINSNRPGDEFLIATALEVEPPTGMTVGRVVYPKAKLERFSFSEKPMSVYDGRAVLRFSVRTQSSLAVGKHKLPAKLTVQACDNQACLRPQTIELDIPVEVVAPGTPTRTINAELFRSPR